MLLVAIRGEVEGLSNDKNNDILTLILSDTQKDYHATQTFVITL